MVTISFEEVTAYLFKYHYVNDEGDLIEIERFVPSEIFERGVMQMASYLMKREVETRGDLRFYAYLQSKVK